MDPEALGRTHCRAIANNLLAAVRTVFPAKLALVSRVLEDAFENCLF